MSPWYAMEDNAAWRAVCMEEFQAWCFAIGDRSRFTFDFIGKAADFTEEILHFRREAAIIEPCFDFHRACEFIKDWCQFRTDFIRNELCVIVTALRLRRNRFLPFVEPCFVDSRTREFRQIQLFVQS